MNRIEFGDCREIMRRWAADGVRVQTCVTSPPYFGLRDYCVDGQLGLEQTPDEYVANMVEVFRAVRDVLADDGTLWLNIGDSYARTGGTDRKVSASAKVGSTRNTMEQMSDRTSKAASLGLKDKDLIGIPWMLAFALRADGWFLRQEIIWAKGVSGDAARAGWSGNPMPESVTDRCTKAHEHIFLLSKSPRYYFDSEAMREEAVKGAAGSSFNTGKTATHQLGRSSDKERTDDGKRNRRSVWTVATRPYKGAHFATFPPALIEPCILAGSLPVGAYEPDDVILSPAGYGEREDDPSLAVGRAGFNRPRRDVEAVRPMSRSEQAAYAEQLRQSPHREEMMRESGGETTFAHYVRTDRSGARAIPQRLLGCWIDRGWIRPVVIPPRKAEEHRSIVLDPFMGSGTTAQVALQHDRQYLGCELNPEYGPLQAERIAEVSLPLFQDVTRLPTFPGP